jgi:hypothetical protein
MKETMRHVLLELWKTKHSRVTKFSKFSPVGRLITIGRFLIVQVAQLFGYIFPRKKFMC